MVEPPKPPPCPPPPPMSISAPGGSMKSSFIPAPPPPIPLPGHMPAPDGAMTIKRKHVTKYKLPTLNWMPLKPNQVCIDQSFIFSIQLIFFYQIKSNKSIDVFVNDFRYVEPFSMN